MFFKSFCLNWLNFVCAYAWQWGYQWPQQLQRETVEARSWSRGSWSGVVSIFQLVPNDMCGNSEKLIYDERLSPVESYWIIIKWLIFHDSMKMQFWFPTTQISTLKSKWTKYVLGSWGNPGGPLHYLETNIRRSTIVKGKKQTLQWGESCERGEGSKRTFLQRLQSFSPRWQGQGGNWPTQHHATKHGFHHSSDLSTSITHNPVPGDGFAKTATSDVLDHEARHWIFGYKSLGGNHQSPRGRTRSWRNAGKEDWDGLQPLSSRPFQLEIHGKCSWRFTVHGIHTPLHMPPGPNN